MRIYSVGERLGFQPLAFNIGSSPQCCLKDANFSRSMKVNIAAEEGSPPSTMNWEGSQLNSRTTEALNKDGHWLASFITASIVAHLSPQYSYIIFFTNIALDASSN